MLPVSGSFHGGDRIRFQDASLGSVPAGGKRTGVGTLHEGRYFDQHIRNNSRFQLIATPARGLPQAKGLLY